MLEEAGEEELREAGDVGDEEAVVALPPPDERVRPRVAHHLVRLGHERRRLELADQPQRELRVEAVHPAPIYVPPAYLPQALGVRSLYSNSPAHVKVPQKAGRQAGVFD